MEGGWTARLLLCIVLVTSPISAEIGEGGGMTCLRGPELSQRQTCMLLIVANKTMNDCCVVWRVTRKDGGQSQGGGCLTSLRDRVDYEGLQDNPPATVGIAQLSCLDDPEGQITRATHAEGSDGPCLVELRVCGAADCNATPAPSSSALARSLALLHLFSAAIAIVFSTS